MPSKNPHEPESGQTENKAKRKTPVGKRGPQNQPTPEEFGQRGMGMAAKE